MEYIAKLSTWLESYQWGLLVQEGGPGEHRLKSSQVIRLIAACEMILLH